jgi:hypothetical protein
VIARKKRQFIGFGFDPDESAHHFLVHIPVGKQNHVTIEEHFEWNAEEALTPPKPPIVKVELDHYRWERISDAAKDQFNKRIRTSAHRSVAWKNGKGNILAPYYGKELTLLAWAVEDIDESLIPNAISNWTGLEPEERWWLYTTVNATFTRTDVGRDRGWRKAIKIAFSENAVPDMPRERFVEEPENIQLPQKDETPVDKVISGAFPKKKKGKKKQPMQGSLFDEL